MDEIEKIKAELKAQTEVFPYISINKSFELIFELTESKEVLINILAYNIVNQPGNLSHNSKGFTLETNGIITNAAGAFKIEIILGDKTFYTTDFQITMRSTVLERSDTGNHFTGNFVVAFYIHQLEATIETVESYYCRSIIPTHGSQLDYFVETTGYRDESMIHYVGKLPISMGGNAFNLYERKYGEKHYFIIDSESTIEFETFSDYCFSIMLGFGFLSSELFQDEAFYFESASSSFETICKIHYLELRPTIRSNGSSNPIYSNPYSYTKDESIIAQVGHKLAVFSPELFSRLCQKLYENQDYAALILLIVEANISSLVLRPAGYSVALEKIANIIVEENKGLKPIPDKSLSKDFISKLNDVLLLYKEEIDNAGNGDSVTILEQNIERINSPTNKDKLTRPFSIHNITLSKEDLECIDSRNNFLHGRNIKLKEGSSQFLVIWALSLRMNKLLNKLILKHLGYSGYTINHLKHNQPYLSVQIEEDLFEQI